MSFVAMLGIGIAVAAVLALAILCGTIKRERRARVRPGTLRLRKGWKP